MPPSLSKSANEFAVDLFHCYLRRHGDKYKNLLLCPYLIYHSLAMMLVGAKGNTAEQLRRLLRVANAEAHISSSSSSSSSSGGAALAKTGSQSSSSGSQLGLAVRPSLTGISHTCAPRSSSSSKRSKRAERQASRRECNSSCPASRAHLTAEEIRHRQFLLLTEQLIHGNHEFVHLASFIYLDKGTKRTERYKAILKDYYETKPKKIDFDNVDLMVKTVNEDVARTTENIYHDILSKQEAQKLEKSYMLLVNAVFFRGFWLSNFTEVKKGSFVKPPVTLVTTTSQKDTQHAAPPQPQTTQTFTVNMMSKLDYLPVLADQSLEARIIKMPFEASDLQMLIILPNNPKSDSTYLCENISATKISSIMDEFAKAKSKLVRISMPVFCIDSGKISIQSTLVTMGAGDLFDKTRANMSGVCENKAVWLHKIIHRCFIICDNRGSITSSSFEKARRRHAKLEPPGATAAENSNKQMEQFSADHPFMYIIIDSVTKTILLIGLYTDPSETLEVIHENELSQEEAHQIYSEGVYKT